MIGHLLACFFGGVCLANAVPHMVAGLMGRSFQSPFAKPRGEGLSSSTVNVLWGFANLVIAYLLFFHVSRFDMLRTEDVLTAACGILALSLFAARHFGRFHGGNRPERA